jgi:hypothetical protein
VISENGFSGRFRRKIRIKVYLFCQEVIFWAQYDLMKRVRIRRSSPKESNLQPLSICHSFSMDQLSPRVSRSLVLLLLATQLVLVPGSQAGQADQGDTGTNAPVSSAALAGPRYSFAKSFTELGEEIVHPKDPYQVIPGKDPNDWFVILEPTGWLPVSSGSIGVKGLPPVHFDSRPNIKNILSHLDFAAMGKLEVRKGRWGLLGEGFFAQLSTSAQPPGPLYGNTTLKCQEGLASLALAYRVIDDRRWFLDVYAGARYNYLGANINSSPDTAAIQNVSDEAVSRISQAVKGQVSSLLADDAAATQQGFSTVSQQALSTVSSLIASNAATTQQALATASQQAQTQVASLLAKGCRRSSADHGVGPSRTEPERPRADSPLSGASSSHAAGKSAGGSDHPAGASEAG